MPTETETEIDPRMTDWHSIVNVAKEAVHDAVLMHKKLGIPIVVAPEGRPVIVAPEDIDVSENPGRAQASRQQ